MAQAFIGRKKELKNLKQVSLTAITPFGLLKNEHSIGLLDSEVTMDDLFAPI